MGKLDQQIRAWCKEKQHASLTKRDATKSAFGSLLAAGTAMTLVLTASYAWAQPPSGGHTAPPEQADVVPVNNHLPNPYQAFPNFGTLPDGRSWGSVSGINVAPDGKNIWVADRCGANSCVGSDLDPVVLLSPDGQTLKAFGGGLIAWPHGMDVDAEGNVWVTDARSATPAELEQFPGETNKGHAVFKFSPEGELLLTLGVPGTAGSPPQFLSEPSDVVVAPDGTIFVAEAHRAQFEDEPGGTSAFGRISKFAADGSYLGSFGTWGYEDGQFRTPHALAMDSKGRLFVADRGNRRLQIFEQDGTHIDTWYQFSRTSGLFIDDNDMLYAIDSESSAKYNPGWSKGLRIGSAVTGEVHYFIPPHFLDFSVGLGGIGAMGEGVTVDSEGNIYAGEVGYEALRGVSKFVSRLVPIESR